MFKMLLIYTLFMALSDTLCYRYEADRCELEQSLAYIITAWIAFFTKWVYQAKFTGNHPVLILIRNHFQIIFVFFFICIMPMILVPLIKYLF